MGFLSTTLSLTYFVLLIINGTNGETQNANANDKLSDQVLGKIDTFGTIDSNELCDCYNVQLKDIRYDHYDDITENTNICYTYSVVTNAKNQNCANFNINNLILGTCDNDNNIETFNILDESISSINSKFNPTATAKPYQYPESDDFGIKIEPFFMSLTNIDGASNEFTICMKNVNNKGTTSNTIQYQINNELYKCSNDNNNGAPCFSTSTITREPQQSDNINAAHVKKQKKDKAHTVIGVVDMSSSSSSSSSSSDESDALIQSPSSSDELDECSVTDRLDICILVDISCLVTEIPDCEERDQIITDFISSFKTTANPRLCYITFGNTVEQSIHFVGGVSEGGFELPNINDLSADPDVVEAELIVLYNGGIEQITTCPSATTDTMLWGALEQAQAEFLNPDIPSIRRQIVIFSTCEAQFADNPAFSEEAVCSSYAHWFRNNGIEVFIANWNTYTGILNPNSNIDDVDAYLSCFTEDDPTRHIGITPDNFDEYPHLLNGILDQICSPDDATYGAGFESLHVVGDIENYQGADDDNDNIEWRANNDLIEQQYIERKALSNSTRTYIKYIFVAIMIFICLNAVCCTFFALRQSGALDIYLDNGKGNQSDATTMEDDETFTDEDDDVDEGDGEDIIDEADEENDIEEKEIINENDRNNKYLYNVGSDDDDIMNEFQDSCDSCDSDDAQMPMPSTFSEAVGGDKKLLNIIKKNKESQSPSSLLGGIGQEFILSVSKSPIFSNSPFKD